MPQSKSQDEKVAPIKAASCGMALGIAEVSRR